MSVEISVIVPVRNGEHSIPALLDSLDRQTLPREHFEVIIVDNDSLDDTASVAAASGATVVSEPVANRARARNRGAAAARSGLYAFTDADCTAHPGWLEALLKCRDTAPLVAGDVRTRVSNKPNAIERFEALWRFGQEAWVEEGWAATANLLVHADAFRAIGGFDAGIDYYGEDVDFCFRARDAGYALGYCAGAVLEHQGEHRLMPFLKRFFMHGYGGNQFHYRLGVGISAWRHPLPALAGDRALRAYGYSADAFEPAEWRRMARLARAGYAARIAGSLWAELRRSR